MFIWQPLSRSKCSSMFATCNGKSLQRRERASLGTIGQILKIQSAITDKKPWNYNALCHHISLCYTLFEDSTLAPWVHPMLCKATVHVSRTPQWRLNVSRGVVTVFVSSRVLGERWGSRCSLSNVHLSLHRRSASNAPQQQPFPFTHHHFFGDKNMIPWRCFCPETFNHFIGVSVLHRICCNSHVKTFHVSNMHFSWADRALAATSDTRDPRMCRFNRVGAVPYARAYLENQIEKSFCVNFLRPKKRRHDRPRWWQRNVMAIH